MKLPSFLLWVASGLLFGISFVSPFLFWSFIPAFVLLLHAIQRERSYYKIFWFGLLVGGLQYAGSFFWIWSVYPINWMPEQSAFVQFCAIGAYWIITSLVMGVGGGLFALAVKRLCTTVLQHIVFVPVAWVISEVVKSICFSIYSFGPGSFVSASFSFGYLGYLLASYGAWLHVAIVGGVYGLSLCAALLCVCVFAVIKTYTKPLAAVLTFSLLVIPFAIPASLFTRFSVAQQQVVAVEIYFDKAFFMQNDADDIKNEHMKAAVERALQEDVMTIVLPEDAEFSAAFKSAEEVFKWIETHAPGRDITLIDTGVAIDSRNESVVRTHIYDTQSRSVYFFDKQYLVPQGEYLSYLYEGVLSLLASEESVSAIKGYARVRPGVNADVQSIPEYVPGILFCFESAVPYAVKRMQYENNRAYVVHPISHAWFKNPHSLEYQLDQMLKVQAVWSRTPIVSAGSMTKSTVHLQDGGVMWGTTVATSTYWSVKRFEF